MVQSVVSRMEVENFLSLLKKVKKTGPGKWMACCPAHGDNNPSMAVSASADGKILVHCFSQGCDVEDIAGSVGLTAMDLFPPRPENWREHDQGGGFRMGAVGFTAHDALLCLGSEGLVVAMVAADIDEGRVPSVENRERISVAVGRILAALEYVSK